MKDVATDTFVVNTTTTSPSHTATLTAGRQYRWNVAAGNSAGLSTYTTVVFFQTPTAVVTPGTPANPSPGSTTSPGTTLAGNTVTLTWDAVSGATSYDLGVKDVATDTFVVNTTTTSPTHTATLTAGRQYRWNVAAVNSAGTSPYTSLRYFQTPTAVVIPGTPANPSPGSTTSPGTTLASSTVTLTWDAVSGATSYDLGVKDVATDTFVVNTTTTSPTHTAALTAGRQYRWNVAAVNSAGTSPYTSLRYFQTPTGGAVDYAGANWIPAGPGHFTEGLASFPGGVGSPRTQADVTSIVIHTTEDSSYGAAISWFQNPAGDTSAHYLVQRDGSVVQLVRERDIAHHAGTPGISASWIWNQRSIGIEVERLANATEGIESAQYSAVKSLVDSIRTRFNVPLVFPASTPISSPTILVDGIVGHGKAVLNGVDPVNWNWASFQALFSGGTSVPTVTTAAATGTTTTTASLSGSANPNGLSTTAYFEWGTSSTLTTFDTTSVTSLASGTTTLPLSADITGLTPGTTYYFRAVAANSAGTVRGSILNFTTTASPVAPIVTTAAATGMTTTTASLSGSANPNGFSTTAYFEWGTSATLTTFDTTSATSLASGTTTLSLSADLSGLSPSTTYYFRAVAVNSGGTVRGSILSFTTSANPLTYAITVSASPSTGVTLTGGGTFTGGSSHTVAATASSPLTFAYWTEGGTVVSSSASYTFTVTGNRALVAVFIIVDYAVAVSASPIQGGTVTGGGFVVLGSQHTVTATANSEYTFVNWTEGGTVVSSSASYTFTLNGSRTLVANFTPLPQPHLREMNASNGIFRFTLQGAAGSNFVVQLSTNLVDWATLSTHTVPVGGSLMVTNPMSGYGRRFFRALPQGLGPFVVQPGPSDSQDIWTTSVYSFAPGGSFPGGGQNDHRLRVGGYADEYYSLLQFDLSGLPTNASSAVLNLYCYSQSGGGTAMYLDRITQTWDWRTQGTGRDRERLWWSDRPPATQLSVGQIPNPTQGQWYSVDITALYNAWKNGTQPNYGVQFRPVSYFSDNFNEFHSADSVTDPALRPKLVVTP